jgi:glucose/arabinose dehydrogenase
MRRGLAVGLGLAVALFVSVAPAVAQTSSVRLTPFGGQFSSPYYVTGAPGDPSRVFVVEGAGTIRLVKNGVTQSTPFLSIPEVYKPATGCDDCGLFSMAFAPDYATSGRFYVFYTRDSTNPAQQHWLIIEEFGRSTANPDVADPASRRIVLVIPHFDVFHHNGGQLQYGPDGLLYASVGDGALNGDPNGNGQNTEILLGKLLRINPAGAAPLQYSIPPDNPFAGAKPGADEIYSYGLRNPWRFSFDRLTGDLMIGDVGLLTREEIDFMPKGNGRGANFGWPCFEGTHQLTLEPTPPGCDPLPPNPTPPVLEYPHPATSAASVTGGYVIRDGALPSLLGRYIYADFYEVFGSELRTAQLSEGGSSDAGLGVFATNVVSFGEDACAHIYVSTIEGAVYRLEPTSGPFPCMPETPGGGVSTGPPTQTPLSAVSCAGEAATISGTEGADRLAGTPGDDVIAGTGGNDTIRGLAGNDVICGGSGKDTLKGGKGNDKLYGQKGKDKLKGGPGKDKLKGGTGKDKLVQ